MTDDLKRSALDGLEFYTDEPPARLIAKGEAWHVGWDIPTRWAIDEDLRCWADNGHGHPLFKRTTDEFLGLFEDEHERNRRRAELRLPPEEPSWMASARAAGWRPPEKP